MGGSFAGLSDLIIHDPRLLSCYYPQRGRGHLYKKAPKGIILQALCNTETMTIIVMVSDTVWFDYTLFLLLWQELFVPAANSGSFLQSRIGVAAWLQAKGGRAADKEPSTRRKLGDGSLFYC